MKTLRKVSFESFDRLSITEASQLYGGTGDNPPTPTLPTDSTQVNKSDSIPPTKKPVQSVTAEVKADKKSVGVTVGYGVKAGSGWGFDVTTSYNNKGGWSGSGKITKTF